jgi:uncharacterized protein YjbI with pentapeptide repeats
MTDTPQNASQPQSSDYQPPKSAEELLRRYAAGERYFAKADIPDTSDLRNSTLADASFDQGWLSDIDFRGANLRHVSFRHCNVKNSDFRGADLEGAIFTGASIEAAQFENANITNVTFAGAYSYGYELKDGDTP